MSHESALKQQVVAPTLKELGLKFLEPQEDPEVILIPFHDCLVIVMTDDQSSELTLMTSVGEVEETQRVEALSVANRLNTACTFVRFHLMGSVVRLEMNVELAFGADPNRTLRCGLARLFAAAKKARPAVAAIADAPAERHQWEDELDDLLKDLPLP